MKKVLKKSIINSEKLTRSYVKGLIRDISMDRGLYIMLLPVILNFIIFHYIPMYGLQIAFKKYNLILGTKGSPWVGFQNFQNFFSSYNFTLVVKNTLIISLYLIIFGFPLPIIFALLLNEIRGGAFKKVAQTISYLPHFISSVIVVGMLIQILSPNGGAINLFLGWFGKEPIYFLGEPDYFRTIYVLLELWRNTGFGAIIYIAAITSIDSEIYESATIDGAGRLKKMWYITIPCLMPTIITLFILRLGGILNVGWQEILLLQNPLNRQVSEVISTFVYRRGLIDADYGYAAAVGMANSVVGFIFVVGANELAKRFSETRLF